MSRIFFYCLTALLLMNTGVPTSSAQSLTLGQALSNAKKESAASWAKQKAVIKRQLQTKTKNIKQKYDLNMSSARNPAQERAYRDQYNAGMRVAKQTAKAQLEKAHAAVHEAYLYSVAQIRRSYGP